MKLLITILITFSCFAQDIVPIQKGEVAQFGGFLISKEQERDMRSKLLTVKRKNVLLSDLNVVQDKRIDFYQKSSEDAYKRLRTEKLKTIGYSIGGFAIGLGVATLVLTIKDALR